jgi:hypothetical protein
LRRRDRERAKLSFLIRGIERPASRKLAATWPPIRSVTDWGVLRYGTCVASKPSRFLANSIDMCCTEPAPIEA